MLHDPSLLEQVEAIHQSVDKERGELLVQLSEPAMLRAIEADLRDQLGQLVFQEYARAARWEADEFDAQADELSDRRRHRRSRADAHAKAQEYEKKLADLPDDPAYDAFREFLRVTVEFYRSEAGGGGLESVSRIVNRQRARANQAVGSQARNTAKRLRRRRVTFFLVRSVRRLVTFLIGFGLLTFGLDQLISGVPAKGAAALALAAVTFLLMKPLEKRATQLQERVYRHWLSSFVNRVFYAHLATEYGTQLDRSLRQRSGALRRGLAD